MEYEVKVEVPDTEDAEAIFDGKFKYLDQSHNKKLDSRLSFKGVGSSCQICTFDYFSHDG